MQKAQDTFISSTFWTDRIGPAAALETLKQMKKTNSWKVITKKGRLIKNEWNSIFKRHNFDVIVSGLDALPIFRFNSKSHLKYKTFITEQMLKKGYLATNSIYLSTAHTDKILKIYLKDFEEVIKKLKKVFQIKK